MPSFLTLPACYRIVTPCSNYPMDKKSRLDVFRQSLQIVLMGRFCKLVQSKTVNYNMQVREGQAGEQVGIFIYVFCHDGRSKLT